MLIGPVFSRELATAPRRTRLFVARTAYCIVLLLLIGSAYLVLSGTQRVRDIGDLARFGTLLFQILAPLQLALAVFVSALLAASAVALEKDRRTLVLLLLTNLSSSELVLGKLLAALLQVFVMLAAAVPVFMLTVLLGGISFGQVGRVFAVTIASILICGSLGSTLALWREKTFQALAMTVLVLVLWLGMWEAVASGVFGANWRGLPCTTWAVGFSPWRAVLEASGPFVEVDPNLGPLRTPVNLFLAIAAGMTVLLNGVAILMVRYWNPSRETRRVRRDEETWRRSEAGTSEKGGTSEEVGTIDAPVGGVARATRKRASRTRHVWDNPILWREMRTWAYGRKILLIRLAYLAAFGLVAASLHEMVTAGTFSARSMGATALVGLFLVSLKLVNAQAVTSLTTERDGRAIDLLLVSDLTPKEFVYGKLGGVFYNAKEMVLLPMLLCLYLWYGGGIGLEDLIYLLFGAIVLYLFVAMLGIHSGMAYENSRSAIATSLGTVFFLFVGVATCMRMMLAFSGTFEVQLPFFGLMVLGGAGLYAALGLRNPSTAIGLASFACPLVTFYAITSFFLDQSHLAFVATVVAYGFTTIALLIPAIDEFDLATGRTTLSEQ